MVLMDHAYFQVAVKALVFDGNKLLVLETPDGYVDFPGGRIDKSEIELSWDDCLRREVDEELGTQIQLDIGQPAFVARRFYDSHQGRKQIVAVFLICQYQSGAIVLSDEHSRYEWLAPQELLAGDRHFMSDDEKAQLTAYLLDYRLIQPTPGMNPVQS